MVCAWKFLVEVGKEVEPEEYFKMIGNGGHREININYR